VGILVNVAFPPAVQTRSAAQAVQKFAGEIASLLGDAAADLGAGPVTAEQSTRWLQDARRLNRHAPRVDRALAHAEESRRLNVRALRVAPFGPGMRTGLDALEHASVTLRTLFRAIDDATRERTGVREDAGYADTIRRTTASLLDRMGALVREFGDQLVHEGTAPDGPDRTRLDGSLEALRSGRTLVQDVLIADPRSTAGLWELNSALLTAVDRLLDELGAPDMEGRSELPGHVFHPRHAAVQAVQHMRLPRRPSQGPAGGSRPGDRDAL
jgi:hypothetical protein